MTASAPKADRSSKAAAGSPANWRRDAVLVLVLAAVAALVFAQTGRFEFVNFDDDVHVFDNPHVTSGLTLESFLWAFGIHGPSQWHPLAWISHQIDWDLSGRNAGLHHAMNAVIHWAAAAILYLALRRMTGRWQVAVLVAAAFLVHPLQVESVAWVSERRNVLCGMFAALTLLAYDRYARRPSPLSYSLVAAGHAAALMSKPMAVTLPCVLMLLDVWPLARVQGTSVDSPFGPQPPLPQATWRRLIAEKLPLFLLSGIAAFLSLECQRAVGTVATLEAIPLSLRVANAVAAYGWYLEKTLWPSGLASFYPHPALIEEAPWDALRVPALVSAFVLLAVTAFALWQRRTQPWLLVGWLWFLGMLVPSIGLVQVGDQQQADRYAYLPLVGLFLAVACFVVEWAGRRRSQRLTGVFAVLVLSAWASTAFLQTSVWRDSQTLHQHAIDVTLRNHFAENNLGMALLEKGRPAEAAEHFSAAIAISPRYALAHYNLGVALDEMGRPAAARSQYDVALQHNPSSVSAHQRLAASYAQSGNLPEALKHFAEAARLAPDDPQARYNYGLALAMTGDRRGAAAEFTRAAELRPDWDQPRAALGMMRGSPE